MLLQTRCKNLPLTATTKMPRYGTRNAVAVQQAYGAVNVTQSKWQMSLGKQIRYCWKNFMQLMEEERIADLVEDHLW